MMREAKAVFIGEVLEIREATPQENRKHSYFFVVRMRVDQYWKGVKTHEVLVSGRGETGVCCDIRLDVGQKYLVYAVSKDMSTACTRTALLAQADKDLKVLGPGTTFPK
jgi:hypothetical protein